VKIKHIILEWILPIAIAFLICNALGRNKSTHEIISKTEETKETKAIQYESINSDFIGTWYCNRINSCNDMDIVLRIAQINDRLSFNRNMVSDSGIGSSIIEGEFVDNQDGSAEAESINGIYTINKEGYLVEYFPSNKRWNIYTRGIDKKIEGRYPNGNN